MVLKPSKWIGFLSILLFSVSGIAQSSYEYQELEEEPELQEELEIPDTFMYFLPGDQHDYNRSPIRTRFDSLKWKRLAEKISFEEEVEDSATRQFKPTKKENSMEWFNFSKIIPYLWLIPVLLIILLVLWRLFPSKTGTRKYKKDILRYGTENLEEEELRELDIEKALAIALKEHKFQLAYRLRYLSVLRELINAHLIFYRKEKTNYEYLLQLSGKAMFEPFRQLTLNFDGIWYGETEINEESYRRLEKYFEEFNSAMKNDGKE